MLLPVINIKRRASIRHLTLLLSLLYSCALSAAVRRVADIVVAPNGTTFSGTLRVTPCSTDVTSTCPPDKYFTVPIVNGYLDADLSPEPNITLFHVQYVSEDQRVQWEEEWSLPAKGMPWQIAELRVRSRHRNTCGVEEPLVNNKATRSELTPGDVRTAPGRPAADSYNVNSSYSAVGHTPPGIGTGPPDPKPLSRPACGDIALRAPQFFGAAVHNAPPAKLQTTRGAMRAVVPTLTEEDVLALVQDLRIRAVLGPGFANSRAAVISDTGGIEGALGALSDCVRVDGTAAPCETNFVDAEIPSGTANGSNSSFTISARPSPASSLQFFRNGLLYRAGSDYTLNDTTITFVSESIPQAGDILLTYYRK
jgi:hypothetical protein